MKPTIIDRLDYLLTYVKTRWEGAVWQKETIQDFENHLSKTIEKLSDSSPSGYSKTGQLKPCPFCGGEAKIMRNSYVMCQKCDAMIPDTVFLDEAIERWEKRETCL